MTQTTTSDIRLRMTKEQKTQIVNLAHAQGYQTVSEFVRSKIFDSDLATHNKLNEILNLLSSDKAKSKMKQERKEHAKEKMHS